MKALYRKVHRYFWTRKAAAILKRYPFGWTPRNAASYAQALYHLYLDEGFGPAEAIECDRSYWS